MTRTELLYDDSVSALLTEWREDRPVWADPDILGGGLATRSRGARLYRGINCLILWHATRKLGVAPGTLWTPSSRRGRAPTVELVLASGRPLTQLQYPRVSPATGTSPHRPASSASPRDLPALVAEMVRRAPNDPVRVTLRRSLGTKSAEQLIEELALAFVGAWLGTPTGEVGPPPGRLRARHLPLAAHLAWQVAASLFEEFPAPSVPSVAEAVPPPPVIAQEAAVDARSLGRALVALLRDGAHPDGSPEWLELRRRHRRATWIHALPLTTLELADAAGASPDPVVATRLAGRVESLDQAAAVLGHPRLSPFREDDVLSALGGSAGWAPLVAGLTSAPWRVHHIRRSDGGLRKLEVPSEGLRRAQRVLGGLLARGFPAPGVVSAFQPGRSVAWHARAHAGARQAVTLDIQDFFGSIRAPQVEQWLTDRPYLPHERRLPFHPFNGWSAQGRSALVELIFRRDSTRTWLPQGAPSSPMAANLAAAPMDRYIRLLFARHFPGVRVQYTRYADDLVASVDEPCADFLEVAPRLLAGAIRSMGWRPHPTKQRSWSVSSGLDLVVCGLRVPREWNDPIRLSRDLARRARAASHALREVHRRAALRGDRDIGLVAFAYSATGDPRWLARISRQVRRLAEAEVGVDAVEAFLLGWEEG